MGKVLGSRLAASVFLLWLVPTITFFLQAFTPGDVALAVLGLGATPEQIDAFNHRLGLDLPLWERYVNWLGAFLHGDLGVSYITSEPVNDILSQRLGISMSLIVGSLVVYTVVGIVAGVASSTGGRLWGRVVDLISTAGIAIPNFWLAVILISVFAVQLNLLPAIGYIDPLVDTQGWLICLILPVISLAFGGITSVAKQTRDQMMNAFASPYTRVLRANGVPEHSLVFKHALRNAAGPVITVLGLNFVGALSGSIVIENIFVLPGLGSQAILSTANRDLPIIQGIAVYFTVIVVIVNVIIDIVVPFLNPKVRRA
jgi:peptide/nickel transport system permease protein